MESKEPLNRRPQKNFMESVFYIAIYNIVVMLGFHNFLKYAI